MDGLDRRQIANIAPDEVWGMSIGSDATRGSVSEDKGIEVSVLNGVPPEKGDDMLKR